MSIKYAKEFFVTEKGEVIKMAAIVTKDPDIIKQLQDQKDSTLDEHGKVNNRALNEMKFFISTFSVENAQANHNAPEDEKKTDFKYVVFHCLDDDQ